MQLISFFAEPNQSDEVTSIWMSNFVYTLNLDNVKLIFPFENVICTWSRSFFKYTNDKVLNELTNFY